MVHMKVVRLSQIIWVAVLVGSVILTVIFGVMLWKKNTQAPQTMKAASVQTDAAAADKPETVFTKEKEAQLLSGRIEAVPVTADADTSDSPDSIEKVVVQQVKTEREETDTEIEDSTDKPCRVLIYHTHNTEAYEKQPEDKYEESDAWRTENNAYNIVAVGERLAKELEALGIKVVHDETSHEQPKLSTAYERSLKTLKQYAPEDFDLIIDLHRDAASARNTSPSVVTYNGKSCARLMLLIGNGSNFSTEHPWKENYALAEALTAELNGLADDLCRDVMVKDGRYNQHISTKCVLIEVGHNENTLSEALNACTPLAIAIEKTIRR